MHIITITFVALLDNSTHKEWNVDICTDRPVGKCSGIDGRCQTSTITTTTGLYFN